MINNWNIKDFELSQFSQGGPRDQISYFLQVLEMLSHHIMKKLKAFFLVPLKKPHISTFQAVYCVC